MGACERVRADRSGAARSRYFDHGQLPVGEVPNPVLRSWKRCWEAGQEANRPICFEQVSRGRIREVDEHSRALVAAAHEEVHQLAGTVANAKLIVMLTDASGTVVESAGDFAAISARLKLAARKGVDLSETTLGTNAVGTALVERGPVAVIAREHYFESNAVHTCAAAPLFGPDGGLIGALDVSGDHYGERPNFIDLVVASARAIENRMLYGLRGVLVLAFSPREDLLATPWEAILAFDPGGGLLGGNAAARGLLGIQGLPRAVRFEDLFDATFDGALRSVGQRGRMRTLQSVGGLRVAARLHEGSGARPEPRAAVPRRTDPRESPTKRESTLAFLQVVSHDAGSAQAVERARCAYDRGVPALLVGETGTGKELVARALHYLGPRTDGPFIAVNCASLPESLVEAELFGYAEGAFTGARRGGAQGRLELASGGTLFLDEIGDMPLASQAKLLRVLQERCVIRLGDNRERPIDVALVCATHQDLPLLIAEKTFREDLYYRINGLCVTLPPLRRRTNILQLARHQLEQHASDGPVCELSERSAELLLSHLWPGNLRQLSHVIASAVALVGADHLIEPEHFPEDFIAQTPGNASSAAPPVPNATSQLVTLDQAEAELIERTLRACHGNVSATARALRVSRSTLYNKLKRG
jgi:sigma-54 dependent transcriptional regulator, acetoin dehydrogenase operon transcriptional activator AcoR